MLRSRPPCPSMWRGWIVMTLVLLLVIAALFLFQFPQIKNTLLSDDVYYHLVVTKEMIAHGNYFPTTDIWFLAPMSRPHVYPPMFHWLMAGLSIITRADLTTVAICLQLLLFPAVIFAFFFLARAVLNPRGVFLSVLLIATSFPFLARTHLAIPEAIELLLICLGLLAYLKRREGLCGLVLLVMLLTHSLTPLIFLIGLIIHQVSIRKYGPDARRDLWLILLIALPGLVLQVYWGNIDLLTTHVDADKLRPTLGWVLKTYFNPLLGLSPILVPLLLALCAFWILRRNATVRLFGAIVLADLLILVTYSTRFPSYALIPMSLLGAMLIEYWLVLGLSEARLIGLVLLFVINVPLSFLFYSYRYDYTHPPDLSEEAFLVWSENRVPLGEAICVNQLFDAYRVAWYAQRASTLLGTGCDTARFLYLRGLAKPPPKWVLLHQEGQNRLYVRSLNNEEFYQRAGVWPLAGEEGYFARQIRLKSLDWGYGN